MRKDVMMISAGLMMMAMASCNQTEYREITEDRVVSQPVDTIKVADHFYLDGYLSRTSEDIGGRQLNAVNLFSDGEELYVANLPAMHRRIRCRNPGSEAQHEQWRPHPG